MIVFENKGELDIRAIKTFGVNSKDNPDSAIGYFGTGLKYAIAILLRAGHKINIITGGVNYEFGVLRSRIRNDDFDIVTMNGEELGFTTSLGKNWEMWMALRELMSNMMDEGGQHYRGNVNNPCEDKTYVFVSGGDFEKCYEERDRYFLDREARSPAHSCSEVDAYEKVGDNAEADIFYKGVRVMQTRSTALFDYNHYQGLTLTEDRTISNAWSTLYHVSRLVLASTDKQFIKQMVMCNELVYEARIDYNMNLPPRCEYFLDVVGELRKKYKDKGINQSAITLHKNKRKLTNVMPGISCHMNDIEQQQLLKATTFCKNILGLELDDYKLIVCKDLGDKGQLGQADIGEGIIYLSKKCFSQGTKRVAVALLEEYTHVKHEVFDETVEQKWIYLEQIMSLAERIQGEPL